MNEIQIFTSPEFGNVRIVVAENKEPLFCLADVCKVLELQPAAVMRRLDKGVISSHPLQTAGGTQQINFVNEDGLYDVILDSRKPSARKFRKWVTSEVLPAIRKSGGYMADKGNETAEELMARALTLANDTLKRREERIRQLAAENDANQQTIQMQTKELKEAAPKVDYYKNTLMSVNSRTSTEVANGIGMTANALNKKLIAIGIAYRSHEGQLLLRQPYLGWGLHETRTNTYTRSDGSLCTNVYTVWTERGRRYIHALHANDFDKRKAYAYIKGELNDIA